MSHPASLPILEPTPVHLGRWMVIIFNNPVNTVDEVIFTLMAATGCDEQEASIETWEAHNFGKAPVHFASQQECLEVASIISNIGVKTEVAPEWND